MSDAGAAARASLPDDDIILPFQVGTLRGRVVRLGPAVDTILRRHDYPPPVAQALAEMVALAAALSATLKFDGVFSMQIKGDGPARLMVADVTTAGELRAYAQFDAARIAALGPGAVSVPKLHGAGYLAFTVDQGDATERYQGIVELTGTTLAECAHHYFRQSEQFRAGLKVAARDTEGGWRAGAVMIQALPPEGAQGSAEGRDVDVPLDRIAEEADELWHRALVLLGSARAEEIVDPALPAWRLVDRLYLAEGVKIFRPLPLRHACRCSRHRVSAVLRSIPPGEFDSLKVDGRVSVTCEFCNATYHYDDADLAALAGGAPPA